MTDRSVTISLSADISKFSREINQAADSVDKLAGTTGRARDEFGRFKKSTDDVGTGLERNEKKVRGFGAAMEKVDAQSANLDRIGNTLLGIGAAAGAGLVGAAKAAIDWEAAWAGVAKTVDGSAAELATLEDQLRGMARTLPATHGEIAAVAEAAGQLGVRTTDIAGFTKVMIDLGETTNLTSDEAATSLAQFMNIMGTASDDVDELGSTIVALGNSGASTEKQIVDMAQRIAGAGNQVGLTETDVLGFASALASVGIEAEAGGTAISTSFLKIEGAVRGGGAALEVLADTAGMTTEEFRAAFEDNAAGAMEQFILGLDRAQKSGGDTTAILKELGITGIRESDALRRLAGAGDLLSRSLDDSAEAWTTNTALAEEAAKRYATTEAQIQIAWNNIKDAAIEAGGALLPIVSDLAEQISELATWFGELPGPVKNAAVSITGIVAVVGLLGGGALRALTGIASLSTSINSLSASGNRAGPALGKFSKALGAAGVALVGLQVAGAVGRSIGGEFTPNIEKAADALIKLSKTNDGKSMDELFKFESGTVIKEQVNGVAEAFKRVNDNSFPDQVQGWFAGLTGGTSMMQDVLKTFGELDRQLTAMPFEQSSAAFAHLRAEADRLGVPLDDLVNKYFPQYADRLRKTGEESGYTFDQTGKLADAMGGKLPPAMDKANRGLDKNATAAMSAEEAQKQLGTATSQLEQAQLDLETQTKDLIDQFSILNNRAITAEESSLGFKDSLDRLRNSTKEAKKAGDEHSTSLGKNSQQGRDNRRVVLDSIRALDAHVKSIFDDEAATGDLDEATRKASKALEQGEEDIRAAAKAAGFSEREIDKMVDQMLKTPKELKTEVEATDIKKVQGQIKDLEKKIKDLEGKIVRITTDFSVTGTTMDFKTGKAIKLGNKVITQFQHEGGPVQNLSGQGKKGVDTEVVIAGVGEHMLTDREVDAIGGHGAVYRLREAALRGELRGYREGGEIRPRSLGGRVRRVHGRPDELEEIDLINNLSGYKVNPQPLMDAYAASMGEWGEALAAKMATKYAKAFESGATLGAGSFGRGSGGVGGSTGANSRRAAADVGPKFGFTSIGTYPGHDPSESRALDFMTKSKSQGDSAAAYMKANADRLNVMYLIWWRRIWSVARNSEGWRPYTRYGNTSNPSQAHTNHIHASFYKGGGYTGDGNPDDLAGFAHRREFVLHEQATSRYRPLAEAMNEGRVTIDRNSFSRDTTPISYGQTSVATREAPSVTINQNGNYGWDPERIAREDAKSLRDAMTYEGMMAAMP